MESRFWFVLACAILIPWQLCHIATNPQFSRPPLPIGDGPDYEAIGYSLSVGKGYSFAWNDPQWKAPYLADAAADEYLHLQRDRYAGPTTVRPPFLPMLIASVYCTLGRTPTAFAAIRCLSAMAIGIAGALAVSIAFDLTRRMSAHRWTTRLAATATLCIAFLDGNLRNYTIDFLSEPLAMLWTTLFLWIALSLYAPSREALKIVLLGLLMAAMIATRSMVVFWIPGVALILILSLCSHRMAKSLAFLALVLGLLMPWWVRNCQLLERFMPMGAQGAVSILGGYSDEALADQGNWHPDAELRLRKMLQSTPNASRWSSLEFERRMAESASIETQHWIGTHYRQLPYLMGLRLKTHWGPYFGKSLLWRGGMLLGVIALLAHRRWEAYWMLGLPVVSSLTVMCLYETGGRFMVPLYGLLYALAGIGVAMGLDYSVRRARTRGSDAGRRPAPAREPGSPRAD